MKSFPPVKLFLLFSFFFVFLFPFSQRSHGNSNCNVNIYPPPSPGTHHYAITLTNNSSVEGYTFINDFWLDGNPGGNINNISTDPYNYWYLVSQTPYAVAGTAGIPIVNGSSITYFVDLTYSTSFDGLDFALESKNDNSFDICNLGHGTYVITFNNLSVIPTPTPTPANSPSPTSSSCSLNIYPVPVVGTHTYTITVKNNTSIPGYKFNNVYWFDGGPGGNPQNVSSQNNWYIHAPTVFGTYAVTGTAGTPLADSITYQTDLTFNNSIDGVDIGLQSQGSQKNDICNQGHGTYTITYNAPSPTPTPTPTPFDLAVPLLKQTNPSWATVPYDSAGIWSPTAPTIGDWGCALTSAAMVLNFNGINKLPDNETLDPGSLNTWLIHEPDGYVGDGLVNWLALSRLSHKAKEINNLSFDGLEYSRIGSTDKTQLTNAINAQTPAILEEPGVNPALEHFVVAKGINGNTFDINDPFYDAKTTLADYNDQFISFGTYAQSNTDLSYIFLTTDPSISLILKDATSGATLATSFTQNPIEDDLLGGTKQQSLSELYYPKPPSGSYLLSISTSKKQDYRIHSFLYDSLGDVLLATESGAIDQNNPNSLTITFDPLNKHNTSIEREVSLSTLGEDIQINCDLGKIKKNVCKDLSREVKELQKLHNKSKKKEILSELKELSKEIQHLSTKLISQEIKDLLFLDIAYLQVHT